MARMAGESVTLVMMPFLGGSWHEWDEVMAHLPPEFRCVGLDLPGFGDAADVPGYSVAEMAEYVPRRVGALGAGRVVLVGHSMAGKVSMALASMRLAGMECLAGMVLVASSPPSPEPMSEARRSKMIAQLGSRGPEFRKYAEEFIAGNVDGVLPSRIFAQRVDDVLRMNCDAWAAWLESGSKEDWADRVGVLNVPALVVAGGADKDLGEEAQRKLTMPAFASAKLVVMTGAAHLMPSERPAGLAELIAEFVRSLAASGELGEYMEFLQSDRVSETTREVLLKRLQPAEGTVFSGRELDLLRAVAQSVVPQDAGAIDLAGRLDAQLSEGKGKGWRYDELPDGVAAYRGALAAINAYAQKKHERPFDEIAAEERVGILELAEKGRLSGEEQAETSALMESVPVLSAAQMKRWFEDCRADLTGIYMSHPATLARIGYSGIGDGANPAALTGFVQLGPGAVEAWEPTEEVQA